jgi:hypothetical protein
MQGSPSADNSYAAQQAAAQAGARYSDAAITQAAMQNFNVLSLNPSNTNKATQQLQQSAAAPAATYAALAPPPYDPAAAPQKAVMLRADGTTIPLTSTQATCAQLPLAHALC